MRAWGPLLRMVRDIHEIMQPAKDEEKRDQPVIVPVFKLAPPAKAPTPEEVTGEPEPAPEARQPLTVDGQVYE